MIDPDLAPAAFALVALIIASIVMLTGEFE
jgi:hypothetical protein